MPPPESTTPPEPPDPARWGAVTDGLWEYEGYDPAEERLREALCTLGSGYFATRGAAPECDAGPHHYPGTYAAGRYNRLTSRVADRHVENGDLVNLPNWLSPRFRFPSEDGARTSWWSPDEAPGPLEHHLSLDLAHGTRTRRLLAQAPDGRRLAVEQVRLPHLGDPHPAALDSVNRYQASKQADVLMLGYLFPPAEPAALFRWLGHRLDDELWRRTVDHYLPRTSHGSTLSGLVHGWLPPRERRPEAWAYVREALPGDVADL